MVVPSKSHHVLLPALGLAKSKEACPLWPKVQSCIEEVLGEAKL